MVGVEVREPMITEPQNQLGNMEMGKTGSIKGAAEGLA